MAVLKLSTPGVYVQEIPSLPPSVAEVETAIPAFIGYTEKAQRFAPDDLKLIPTKINNLGEFVLFYGVAPQEAEDSISISVTDYGSNVYNTVITAGASVKSNYNLYYALKHFYDNGGGTCFVVSVDKAS
jgi:phage tail sheath protein FI